MTTFRRSIDLYVADMWAQARFRSEATERSYRSILDRHALDVDNRDPRTIGRSDIKRTLARWSNPNTQATCRAILASFYAWTMEEGLRKDNPVLQTRRPRRKPPAVYRMTRAEAAAMLRACRTDRERRVIYLGICAGLRNAELRGLQGRHFQRPGWIWVSPDIGKGGRYRWIPIIADLGQVCDEIVRNVAPDEYVICAQRWRDPGINRDRRDYKRRPASAQAIYYLVGRVGKRAGISADIHPHLLRHAFGDHVARFAGMRNAQALLGHAGVETTQMYTGQPTLDELAASVEGFGFLSSGRGMVLLPQHGAPEITREAPSGLEPEQSASRLDPGDCDEWVRSRLADLAPSIQRYAEALR